MVFIHGQRLFQTVLLTVTLLFAVVARGFPIQMALSPDNNFEFIVSQLRSTQREVLINIYEFNHAPLANSIESLIRSGKTVQILVEGEPVGKMSNDGRKILAQFQTAMKESRNPENHLFVMTRRDGTQPRRFVFDHAKYLIIDSSRVLISSENFSKTGHPQAGSRGNRGWEIVLEHPSLVVKLTEIFRSDTSDEFNDIVDLAARRQVVYSEDREEELREDIFEPRTAFNTPVGHGNAIDAKLTTSPDSLASLLDFIQSAHRHLEIEEMSLPLTWKIPETVLNPLVAGIINAARGHAKVRVLLNDESVFSNHSLDFFFSPIEREGQRIKNGNKQTVKYLDDLARQEGLDLDARIVDYQALGITYIHNKGLLADGVRAWVGSVNGTRNSVMNNREVGVTVESREAAAYFGEAFERDWKASEGRRIF